MRTPLIKWVPSTIISTPEPQPLSTLSSVPRVSESECMSASIVQDDLSEKCTTPNEMTKFAKEQGFFSWILISVKENTNVDEMMT